jgi:hypothetical protein
MLHPLLLLTLFTPAFAHAEDLCESRASIHQRATYCHENWAFLDPAHDCVQTFANQMSAEQARLKKLLNTDLKAQKGAAQNLDFTTNDSVLKTSLAEVTHLIDVGKQTHTELEDYVYALTLPIYDSQGASLDPTSAEAKEQFMQSECYSDPSEQIESMEMQMRPWITELEKTKAQLTAMAATTMKRDDHLGTVSPVVKAAQGQSAPTQRPVPAAKPKTSGSTITGEIHDDPLPLLNK